MVIGGLANHDPIHTRGQQNGARNLRYVHVILAVLAGSNWVLHPHSDAEEQIGLFVVLHTWVLLTLTIMYYK
jgi:hypothetical protein